MAVGVWRLEVSTVVVADQRLHPRSTQELLDSLSAARGTDLRLDASQVETVSTQAFQILLVCQKTWQSDGNSFQVSPMSAAFAHAAQSLGIGTDIFQKRPAE